MTVVRKMRVGRKKLGDQALIEKITLKVSKIMKNGLEERAKKEGEEIPKLLRKWIQEKLDEKE